MAPYIVVELRGNVPIKPHARAKIDLSADSGVRPQLVMRSFHCHTVISFFYDRIKHFSEIILLFRSTKEI